jgi:hypothetical protein
MTNMKALAQTVATVLFFAGIPATLLAQWPPYPTPNVPKLADGKPNLEGPTPRTADGHPDFSGIWQFEGSRARRPPGGPGVIAGSGPGPAPAAGAAPTTTAATTTAPAPPPGPPTPGVGGVGLGPRPPGISEFFDIGSTVPGGLPFTPWAVAVRKERKDNNNKDNPDAHCLPLGLTQLHMHPQPRKIIQTPQLMVILYEAQGGVRQIFMDGRKLPNNDPDPWWYGYSIGHWDGDTLVVETTGFRDDVWLDVEGSPLTNTGKMTERFSRPSFGHLEMEITIEDPKAYTKPWTVKMKQRLLLDTDLIEFICNENEKSDAHLVGK